MHTQKNISTAQDICTKCAHLGQTCCQADPKDSHLFFPLSQAEWQRLQPYVHLAILPESETATLDSLNDMTQESEPNTAEFVEAMCRLFPDQQDKIRTLFPFASHHFRVRITKKGDCIFLGKQGCRLPKEARPWYCLLFPSWVDINTVTYFVPETCLLIKGKQSATDVCALMGKTLEQTKQLHACLKNDWGLTPLNHKK